MKVIKEDLLPDELYNNLVNNAKKTYVVSAREDHTYHYEINTACGVYTKVPEGKGFIAHWFLESRPRDTVEEMEELAQSIIRKYNCKELPLEEYEKVIKQSNESLKEGVLMSKYDLDKLDTKDRYRMLDRMRSDCEYCIDSGSNKHLWVVNDPKTHCDLMRELYDSLEDKPDWLSLDDIDRYEKTLLGESLKEDTVEIKNGPVTYTGFDTDEDGKYILKCRKYRYYLMYQRDAYTQEFAGYVFDRKMFEGNPDYRITAKGILSDKYGSQFLVNPGRDDYKYYAFRLEDKRFKTKGVDSVEEGVQYLFELMGEKDMSIKDVIVKGDSLSEDTVKTSDGKWTNKGKEGTHGKFKTKKQADAQRKAMFANGFHESMPIKTINGKETGTFEDDNYNRKLAKLYIQYLDDRAKGRGYDITYTSNYNPETRYIEVYEREDGETEDFLSIEIPPVFAEKTLKNKGYITDEVSENLTVEEDKEAFRQEFEESLDPEEDPNAVEKTRDYIIYKDGDEFGLYVASWSFNPAVNRWMRRGWSPILHNFETVEEARQYALDCVED